MSQKAAVLAFRDALLVAGATEFRLPMQTDAALQLADELTDGELNHPIQVASSLAVIKGLRGSPEPEALEQKLAYYRAIDVAVCQFWDAFEGQEVHGVVIVRKR